MGKKDGIYWNLADNLFPTIQPHTKAKHLLLSEYLLDWLDVLCARNPFPKGKVTLIDGFCGGGLYRDEESDTLWEGSPLRMIKVIEEGYKRIKEEGSKPYYTLDFNFIFIDKQKEHIDFLRTQLINAGYEKYIQNGQCSLIHSLFEEAVPLCIEKAKKGHSFFFIDPFGPDGISQKSIRKILKLNNSEILWNFMIGGLLRLLPEQQKNQRIIKELLEAERYFDFSNYQYLQNSSSIVTAQQYVKNQAMTLIREQSNVKYLYPFAIMRDKCTVLSYLVHLANDTKALEVMKRSIWKYNNLEYRYHYEVYGCGFRSQEYYEQSLRFVDIEEANLQDCLEDLYRRISPYLSSDEMISAKNLYSNILEQSPATFEHFSELINELKNNNEIEIYKSDGSLFKGRKLTSSHFLKLSSQKSFFNYLDFNKMQ